MMVILELMMTKSLMDISLISNLFAVSDQVLHTYIIYRGTRRRFKHSVHMLI